MNSVVDYYSSSKGARLFCIESLTAKGSDFGAKGKVRLLADEDILFTAKNCLMEKENPLIEEYFTRNKRRFPLWKSEAEYRALFEKKLGSEAMDFIEAEMDFIIKFLMQNEEFVAIDKTLIQHCEQTISKSKAELGLNDHKDYTDYINGRQRILKLAQIFQIYAAEVNVRCDFMVIKASKFKSNFAKKDIDSLLIYFEAFKKVTELNKVMSMPLSQNSRDNFFYVFCRRSESGQKIDPMPLVSALRSFAVK